MSLQIGIVGLPNVGKSTLFNALTKNNVLAANYPFATIDPNTGVAPVPDERLDRLVEVFEPKSVVPATVTFVDIAGLVKGAAEGQGLGNQFLSHIRGTDAICQVVRAFDDPNVTHVEGKINPKSDIETINAELILADLALLKNRISKLESEAKADPSRTSFLNLCQKISTRLNEGHLAGSFLSKAELDEVQELQLLTTKPFIIVFNLNEGKLTDGGLREKLTEIVATSPTVFLCAKVEADLMEMPDDEANDLLSELGQKVSGLGQLAHAGYKALDLVSFFTAGEPEVRAWTVRHGSTAPEAAGVIHTDFQKGFIRAETVGWQELVEAGGWNEAKAKGKVRSEGKDYVIKDGDTILFRFNV